MSTVVNTVTLHRACRFRFVVLLCARPTDDDDDWRPGSHGALSNDVRRLWTYQLICRRLVVVRTLLVDKRRVVRCTTLRNDVKLSGRGSCWQPVSWFQPWGWSHWFHSDLTTSRWPRDEWRHSARPLINPKHVFYRNTRNWSFHGSHATYV